MMSNPKNRNTPHIKALELESAAYKKAHTTTVSTPIVIQKNRFSFRIRPTKGRHRMAYRLSMSTNGRAAWPV